MQNLPPFRPSVLAGVAQLCSCVPSAPGPSLPLLCRGLLALTPTLPAEAASPVWASPDSVGFSPSYQGRTLEGSDGVGVVGLGDHGCLAGRNSQGSIPCFLQSSQDLPKVTKQVRKKQSAQAQFLTSRIL